MTSTRPGAPPAVIVADRETWAGAAGTADGAAPLYPTAQFAIGSVTKTIIAAQVLRLVESGAVDLDRPIAEYLGEYDLATNGATGARHAQRHRRSPGSL